MDAPHLLPMGIDGLASFVARAAWSTDLHPRPDEIGPAELTPRLLSALG